MKFGLFFELTTPKPWDGGAEKKKLDEMMEQVVLADKLGLDHVWVTEHHFMEEYCHATAPDLRPMLACVHETHGGGLYGGSTGTPLTTSRQPEAPLDYCVGGDARCLAYNLIV